VRLFGKGRKERICPLWPETVQLLKQYLLRFGRRAADTFCRLKQSRRHRQSSQKHEQQITRMLRH
jgi:integrase